MIDSSVERFNAGKLLANDAGKVMQEIITSVNEVTGIITDISSASSEQSDGIGQVNDAVMQMDGVTQQNAALVQEATIATRELEKQATKLMQGLRVFKLRTQHEVATFIFGTLGQRATLSVVRANSNLAAWKLVQNSALVEENSATAMALEHQAQAMDDQAAFFRIDGAAHDVTSEPAPPTPTPARIALAAWSANDLSP